MMLVVVPIHYLIINLYDTMQLYYKYVCTDLNMFLFKVLQLNLSHNIFFFITVGTGFTRCQIIDEIGYKDMVRALAGIYEIAVLKL